MGQRIYAEAAALQRKAGDNATALRDLEAEICGLQEQSGALARRKMAS